MANFKYTHQQLIAFLASRVIRGAADAPAAGMQDQEFQTVETDFNLEGLKPEAEEKQAVGPQVKGAAEIRDGVLYIACPLVVADEVIRKEAKKNTKTGKVSRSIKLVFNYEIPEGAKIVVRGKDGVQRAFEISRRGFRGSTLRYGWLKASVDNGFTIVQPKQTEAAKPAQAAEAAKK